MSRNFKLILKDYSKKARYINCEIQITYFSESFIRTSIGNDGNDDGDWGDENAKPMGTF